MKTNKLKANQMEEVFPLVDEWGKVVGNATRSRCHDGSKLLHPVVHLHVFDSTGQLFLQKRSPLKDVQPNLWDSSSSGHIDLGETPSQAVLREAREELGIVLSHADFVDKYIIETDTERELTYCFRVVYNGEIRIDGTEVTDGRFWTLAEIGSRLNEGIFTQNFVCDFRRFYME